MSITSQKQNHTNLKVRGARHNNLKDLDLDIPLNQLTIITGVSGSGKSSLAFDTIYAEGQRRYIETFSPYARQFLDRMDRPNAESIDNVPPAVAINQVNPVRTTRSTVGTMTEINDYLKVLFARVASLYCPQCGNPVKQLTTDEICDRIIAEFGDVKLIRIMFPIHVPKSLSTKFALEYLKKQGYTRIAYRKGETILVVQDRLRPSQNNRSRLIEALEVGLARGSSTVIVQRLDDQAEGFGAEVEYTDKLRCCGTDFSKSTPNLFSFNSPVGACETCRGFGKTIGIDYGQVIPDESLTLRQGAIRAFNSPVYIESYRDILNYGAQSAIPLDTPWNLLEDRFQNWVIEGEGGWYSGKWYGVKRFFNWLEGRKHRMHVRVFLSHYRSYTDCGDCGGARLKPQAFNWRLGTRLEKSADHQKFRHPLVQMSNESFARLPGLTIHDVASLPISQCVGFFSTVEVPESSDEAANLLLNEIRARIGYLDKVGLGYLNLDRQSRTLSGGEVQRINLTTALGTTLVNTLFVLDEPTIGLHSRDTGRIIEILHQLRDAGNTLMVVEHEEQVIRAADRIVDLGPGPGTAGGNLVHFGTFNELLNSKTSLTAACLRDGDYLPNFEQGRAPLDQGSLKIYGAEQNNLKCIDVSIPLRQLVCVTGVSGSGKSTLIEEVLYRGVLKQMGKSTDTPGQCRAIEGLEQIHDIELVSQAQIGKTTRSNPASYVDALSPIRELFANQPLAKTRHYSAGSFSFNSTLGRCDSCEGSGFERIEMQFLSDVYLRCPDCAGNRFRAEISDVTIPSPAGTEKDQFPKPLSIVDVLNLTVHDAIDFFQHHDKVTNALSPLVDVGLGYLTLGQPVPTLSGGEAQRLKLAAHIAKKTSAKRKNRDQIVFLFDEPTTGLHFSDVANLITSLRKLIDAGHSVVVIEHNLDLVSSSDWLIDLGPEGGDLGGELIAEGPPKVIAKNDTNPTALALSRYFDAKTGHLAQVLSMTKPQVRNKPQISVHNAREHNLKEISLSIPYNAMTVITGMSGSGKSTLAFDILFAEGQKRYLATINAYARQFVQPASRADFDAVTGLPPTVAISQMVSRGGRRSTVATLTEIYHYIRLLYVRFGTQYCPDCNAEVNQRSVESIIQQIVRERRNSKFSILAPLVVSRKGHYGELGETVRRRGIQFLLADGRIVPTAKWKPLDRHRVHDIDVPVATVEIGSDQNKAGNTLRKAIDDAQKLSKGHFRLTSLALTAESRAIELELFSTTRSCSNCGQAFEELDPRLFSYNSKQGWCESCFGTGVQLNDYDDDEESSAQFESVEICAACDGKRLNRQALAVRFHNITIDQLTGCSVQEAKDLLSKLTLTERERVGAHDIFAELTARLEFLQSVGLSYLSLDRAAPTLSGGEAQRIRLAAQLGSSLCGACYILDEPTIGLHSRDNELLLSALHLLRDKGNTIVVVEHDEATIVSADHIIDLGPGGGTNGGKVIASGTLSEICSNPASVTGAMLKTPLKHPMKRTRCAPSVEHAIKIKSAKLHNLQNVDVTIPVQALVCVTGVSGSGKSTLVREVLYPNLHRVLARKKSEQDKPPRWDHCAELSGWDQVRRVLEVDQTPIGKTPRSCPATYVNVWQTVRKLFAETPEARLRGYSASRFSFNVAEGRCPVCNGQGEKKIEMNFLPDVRVRCENCDGARFNAETLDIRYREKTIAQVLDLSIEEAQAFFSALPSLERVFGLLVEVGLGYLRLGQPSPTLSGGEAQRIKLVAELSKALPRGSHSIESAAHGRIKFGSLYVLDEPTVGLHSADVEQLLRVIHALVDTGNTVVVIEHNLDVVAEADWVIDMGPEGGDGGGRVVVEGALSRLKRSRRSHTGGALRNFSSRSKRSKAFA